MQYLRNVAEVDPDDIKANTASALAQQLESAGLSCSNMSLDFNDWSVDNQEIVRYAISKRKQYVLLPNAKHAVNLNPE